MTFNSCCILSSGLEAELKSPGLFQTKTASAPRSAASLIVALCEMMVICSFAKFFLLKWFFSVSRPFHSLHHVFVLWKCGAAGDKKVLLLSPACLEILKSNEPQHVWGDKHQRGEAGNWLFPQNENKCRNAQFTDRQDLLIEVK